jgi:uncharacterized protein (TIGR03083 family)
MLAAAIDLPATQLAISEASGRVAGILERVRSPGARVPGLDWTLAETAAHLVSTLDLTAGILLGEGKALEHLRGLPDSGTAAARRARSNARLLQSFAERDPQRLAELVVETADRLVVASGKRRSDEPVENQTGVAMTAPVTATLCLGELLVHGLDIARAAGERWGIPPAEALLVVAGVVDLVPEHLSPWRSRRLHAAYELRLRGGPRYHVAIDEGSASVPPPGRKTDCWISADPVAFLLVGYGRLGQWGQVLRGKIVPGGRHPLLGPKFASLLTSV